MKKENWVWMPHWGHFICGQWCRFKMNTYVGGYIVSTIGEYLPDAPVREIFAKSRNVVLEGIGDARLADYRKKIGFEEIGYGRTYETMVFPARKSSDPKSLCCPYEMSGASEVDSAGYTDSRKAFEGHLKMCRKWAKKNDRK